MRLKRAARQLNHKVTFDILEEYSEPLEYVYINDSDQDLQKWRITMPEPPHWDKIHGFGKRAKDQVFEYEQFPLGLKNLENKIRDQVLKDKTKKDSNFTVERTVYEKIWETLEREKVRYEDEINWIRNQWYYRENGKWMFIKGTPYLITPDNWFYCNYFSLKDVDTPNGLPQFRYRDFKWFWAQQYCETTTESVYKDENGNFEFLEDGTLRMIDIGSRTLLGTNNLKGRRVGETSKVQSMNLRRASSYIDYYGGIQGNSEDTARDVYTDKLLYAFNKLPFFFIPKLPNLYFTSELNFCDINQKSGLNSKIVPATTQEKEFYDGKKLRFLHVDEIGKTKCDIIERHGVQRKCLMEGSKINGTLTATSTAEDMDAESGQNFEKMSMESMFENRLPNGQTISGLVNVFFPMWESFNDFIDRYGFPIVDTPEDYQIKDMGKVIHAPDGHVMGCKEYLEAEEEALRKAGDLRKLAQTQRQNPKTFRECFALAAMNQFFNTDLLQARLQEIKFTHDKRIRGNFHWDGIPYDSRVSFVRDDINGRFFITMQLPEDRRSLTTSFSGGYREPAKYKDVFISSADPYRLEKTDSYRFSLGSFAVLYKFDPLIDTTDKQIQDWTTSRFVCSYVNKPNTIDEYCEDVLKGTVYYNALCFPENNVSHIQDFFLRKGYQGYLAYRIDPVTGKRNVNAGWTTAGTGGNVKNKIFTLIGDWINKHALKCEHPEILEELLRSRGTEDMKNRDLLVAIGGCLMAEEMGYADVIRKIKNQDKVNLDDWWG